MTRTRIISADGTHFVPVGRARHSAIRTLKFTALALAMLFLSAAVIGLVKGAQGDYAPAPVASSAEAGIDLNTAKKACRKAPRGAMQDCLALYMRSDWHTANTYTPKGAALVKECFAQYRGQELRDCLTQEI